jgi:hypothetical protein
VFPAEYDALINQKVLEIEPRWTLMIGMFNTMVASEVKNRWKMPERATRTMNVPGPATNRR